MMCNLSIKEITSADADIIISTRQPLGLFYLIENGVYVGIDNSTGDAWTEDFLISGNVRNGCVACERFGYGGQFVCPLFFLHFLTTVLNNLEPVNEVNGANAIFQVSDKRIPHYQTLGIRLVLQSMNYAK